MTTSNSSITDTGQSQALSEAQINRLRDLRLRLLHLHKSLLEMERLDFEKMFGRVTTGELLQLVINHAQFGWLRMISALVVEIDELLNDEEPPTRSNFENLIGQARLLFTSAGNEEFKSKYQAALQREPAVVMAHANLMQALRQDS